MKKLNLFVSLVLVCILSSCFFVGCGKKNESQTISLAEAKQIVLTGAELTYNKYHTQTINLTSSTSTTDEKARDVFACFKYVEFNGHADLDMSIDEHIGKHIEDFSTIIENNDGVFSRYTIESRISENNNLTDEDYEYNDGEKIYCYDKINESYFIKDGDYAGLGPDHRFVQYAKMWLDEDGFETRFKDSVIKTKTNNGYNLVFRITLLDYITYSWNWSPEEIDKFMQKVETEQRYKDCYSNLNPTLTISFNNNNEFTSFELYVKGQQFWDDDPVNYNYEHKYVIRPTDKQVETPAWFTEHNWQ